MLSQNKKPLQKWYYTALSMRGYRDLTEKEENQDSYIVVEKLSN
jgi:hypothetical protein